MRHKTRPGELAWGRQAFLTAACSMEIDVRLSTTAAMSTLCSRASTWLSTLGITCDNPLGVCTSSNSASNHHVITKVNQPLPPPISSHMNRLWHNATCTCCLIKLEDIQQATIQSGLVLPLLIGGLEWLKYLGRVGRAPESPPYHQEGCDGPCAACPLEGSDCWGS